MIIIDTGQKCDATCPAAGTVEVEILGEDFRFCQHHYNALEPALAALPVKVLEPAS